MTSLQDIANVALIGIGATAVMDVWLALLQRLGIRTSSFALVGRWLGHFLRGQFAHADIARAKPVAASSHGAGSPTMRPGSHSPPCSWSSMARRGHRSHGCCPPSPSGFGTVLVPLCVMQPAMGAGFMASKTPSPWKNCLRSLANPRRLRTGPLWDGCRHRIVLALGVTRAPRRMRFSRVSAPPAERRWRDAEIGPTSPPLTSSR
jgi:hypothetical protein